MAKDKSKGFKIFMRIMNAVTALTLIGFGIAGIIILSIKELAAFRFFLAFSPMFLVLFGLMLLGADFKFQVVKKYFFFMHSMLGRGVFNIYLSTVVFFYFSCGDDSDVLAWIAAIIIFVLGVFYCVAGCCCSDKEEDESDKKQKGDKGNDSKKEMNETMM